MFERWLAPRRGQPPAASPPGPPGVPDRRMAEAVALWSDLYRGKPPWKPRDGGLGLAAAIASELARQTTLELQSRILGSRRAEFLDRQYRRVLDRLRPALEVGCATGALALKPFPDGEGGLSVDLVGADRFWPTAFDAAGRMTGAVFFESRCCEGIDYLRCESHDWRDGRYRVTNEAFRLAPTGSRTPVPLAEVPAWAGLSPAVCLEGIDRPLFACFRVPFANWIDPGSPMGVSVYSRVVGLIRQADEQWERILWEFEGGELAVDASSDLFRLSEDGRFRLPRGKERLFRVHDVSLLEARGRFLETFSPALRDASLLHGLDSILKRIEFGCGLAYGTLSDPQSVEKTAEEIRAGKQRSYATVSELQRALQAALTDLAGAMNLWAGIARLAPAGRYEMSFCWDDSIVTDAGAERDRDLQEVREGLMLPWEYRVKWRGEDEQTARRAIEEQAAAALPPNAAVSGKEPS